MNVVFLDIDGVLNKIPEKISESIFFREGEHMESSLIENFNLLFEQRDIKIVISSSWREDMDDLRFNLEKNGFKFWNKVIGRTSFNKLYRGELILEYLNENKNIQKYLVIDDSIGDICSEDFEFISRENILKINPKEGFSFEDLDFCLSYFIQK